jgi:hypothetical protein
MANKMTVEQVDAEAKRLHGEFSRAKVVADQERALGKLHALAEAHAEVNVPGLDSGSFRALRAHLKVTKREIERYEAKAASGNPAIGGKLRELRSEADSLVRQIRARENAILDSLGDVKG